MSASLASSRSKASPSIQDSSRDRPRGGLLVKVDTRTAGAPHSIQCLACRSFSSRTSPLTPYAGLQVVPRYRGVPARGDKCGANLGPFTVVMGFLWLHKHLTNRPNLRGFLPQIDSHGGSRRFESCCAHQLNQSVSSHKHPNWGRRRCRPVHVPSVPGHTLWTRDNRYKPLAVFEVSIMQA